MAQDYKTMRVPAEAYRYAKDAKRDDETWGEFMRRLSDNPPEPVEYVDADAVEEVIDPTAVAVAVADELEGRQR